MVLIRYSGTHSSKAEDSDLRHLISRYGGISPFYSQPRMQVRGTMLITPLILACRSSLRQQTLDDFP